MEVSAQNKLATLLSPKQTVLLSLFISPEGALAVPALWPKSVLFDPVETLKPAEEPIAVFVLPVVTVLNDWSPTPVLSFAVVFASNALDPIPTFLVPVVFACKDL